MSGEGAALPNWSKLSELSQLIVEIDFENNSTAIEPKSYRTVGLIADTLHHPDLYRYKFLIVAHSSATGSAKHNLELSQKRADAINEALSTRYRTIASFPWGPAKSGRLTPAIPSQQKTDACN